MNRKPIFAILLALAVGAALVAGPVAAQRHLSTDLLLPSFEVDLTGQGMTTLWSVTNALDQPVAAVATVYSNWGLPVLAVPVDLDSHQVRTVNLRDWLVAGNLPAGPLSADALSELQATLSGQASPKDGLFYSNPTLPDRAMGYVVVRLAPGPERPAALFGDFFVMGPGKAAAAGDTLVDLTPTASCSDLCSRHALRFLSGAQFDNGTEIIIWTPKAGQPATAADEPAAATVAAHARLYDETGQLMGERQLSLHPLSIVGMNELTPTGPFGWVDLDLGTSSFVGVRYSGKSSDSIAFQSTCLPAGGGGSAVPGLSIRKLTNGIHSESAPGPTLAVGSPVTWSYVVRNTGQVPLTQVSVTDDQGVAVHCPKTALDPGEEMSCTGAGTAVACQYTNTGTVLANPPQGPALEAQDVSYYYGDPAAALTLTLSINGQRSTTSPGIEVATGSPLSWTYLVTNTGKSLLTGVTVTDDQGVAVSCPRSRLAPGAAMTCTASGTAASGQHGNLGTAAGQTPCGPPVTAQDRSYYHTRTSCSSHPAIQIEKYTNGQHATAAPGPTIAAGAAVTWTYEVTNSGDVTLANVAVSDDRQGAVTCPKSTLAPQETMTCTAHGTAVAGQYKNVGTATGQPSCGNAVSAYDSNYYYGQSTPPPPPPPTGNQGCSPGYWKNHPASWPATGYSTGQSVSGVFHEATRFPSLGAASLLQALSFQGGSDLNGAAQTLLRAGVAALLNAADPQIAFPRQPQEVIASVNSALASGDRSTMTTLAGQLDTDNNLYCPLH
jgi:hypothetical protein